MAFSRAAETRHIKPQAQPRSPFQYRTRNEDGARAASFGALPLAAIGAAFAPPLETPTSAGRSTRSPIMKPACTT
jgi:hypothetical protein